MIKFEKHSEPLASRKKFISRLLYCIGFGIIFILISLIIGVLGYHFIAELSWVDSFLDASMILSNMGPVSLLKTDAGKIFAAFYALFSGVLFIIIVGVVFAPVVHRFLHKFLIK